MSAILIVSTDVVGSRMAGPGIRALELSRALSAAHSVTLAVPGNCDIQLPEVRIMNYAQGQSGSLGQALSKSDVVIGQGFVFESHLELLECELPLAIDLYDPLILESLDLYAGADLNAAMVEHVRYLELTTNQLRRGDFFFCATERQRDYWLGALSAAGRINPQLTRRADRDLRQLIDLVPSGIPQQPPQRNFPVLRGVHPAVDVQDMLLVWAGGLWDWFDPLIVIRAMAALRDRFRNVRLCFFAGARPNPAGEPFRTENHHQARALASELGLLDQSVIFLEEWIPYLQRGAFLSEANAGVSAHLPGLETRFAFRTRLLDYVWAQLPVITSGGDSLGQTIVQAGGGIDVPPGDLEGWIAAISRMAAEESLRRSCRAAMAQLADDWTWPKVVRPLDNFCRSPRRFS